MQYICEVCGKTEELTEDEAFVTGWDYPPFMGIWGVVSPRTCGNCGIDKTVWWALTMGHVPYDDLTEEQLAVVGRILAEVPSDLDKSENPE